MNVLAKQTRFFSSSLVALLFGAFLLGSPSAEAGDPCPIDFGVVNFGPFHWDNSMKTAKDPIFHRLMKLAKKQDCTTLKFRSLEKGEYSLKLGPKVFLGGDFRYTTLLDAKKSYRCKDAHKDLGWLKSLMVDGTQMNMVYQRGTRRVMLTLAGSNTVCMDLKDLQDDKGLLKLWNAATKLHVQDRHDNP